MIRPIRGSPAEYYLFAQTTNSEMYAAGIEETENNPRGKLELQRLYRCNRGVKDEFQRNENEKK